MRLPTKSHRPVMLFLSGMSSLLSTGKTARLTLGADDAREIGDDDLRLPDA
jgi:hypothetical protein